MTHESIIARLKRDYKDGIGAMLTSNDIKELLKEVNDEQRKYNANLQNKWNRQEVWDEGCEKGYMDAWDKATKQFQEEIANAKKTIERDEALRIEYHKEIAELKAIIEKGTIACIQHTNENASLKTDIADLEKALKQAYEDQ